VQARDDSKIYFIRDPKNLGKASVNSKVSWALKTMGRTEALAQSTAEIFVYDKKSKTKFEMALLMKECTL
jgi:hypothetical protein